TRLLSSAASDVYKRQDSGKVQLRTLLVGVIKPESPATAAAILASKDPAKTWQEYESSGGKLKLNVPANVST
ncbi:hypothetical protein KQJ25_40430, partial [Escherichia sp. S69_ASV_4]|nr:hypothetical protein [Escherichia sp. S69_ASV_4]